MEICEISAYTTIFIFRVLSNFEHKKWLPRTQFFSLKICKILDKILHYCLDHVCLIWRVTILEVLELRDGSLV
jgi:hypothetical protein